jgi:hypothetical protein
MPFNWGYVSKIISPDMNAICQNEKHISMVSAFPYLLDQHYLRYQFDVVKGQDMSTTVTYYTHSKQSDKINKIKSEVSVDTTSKIFDKRNNLIVQTANYLNGAEAWQIVVMGKFLLSAIPDRRPQRIARSADRTTRTWPWSRGRQSRSG